jgi:hypothetical protein
VAVTNEVQQRCACGSSMLDKTMLQVLARLKQECIMFDHFTQLEVLMRLSG